MGVDYTAFVAWGVPIKQPESGMVDVFESESALLKKHRAGYTSFGSRSYGGPGGVMLTIDERYIDIDMSRDGAQAKPLPPDQQWNQVEAVARLFAVRDAIRAGGVEIDFDGEPGWYVCGHVW